MPRDSTVGITRTLDRMGTSTIPVGQGGWTSDGPQWEPEKEETHV